MASDHSERPWNRHDGAPSAPGLLAGVGFSALAVMPLPIVLIGPHGIAFANEAGENLLAQRDGICICSGRYGLRTTDEEETPRLRAVIASALIGGPGGLAPATRQRSTLPLLLEALPLRGKGPALPGNGRENIGFALVLIRDPQPAGAQCSRAALMNLYGLTEAEARVAEAIVAGHNAKQIARLRDVSVPTVRSQIRQILAKTGCCDQRQLISRFGWLGVMA